LGARVVVVLDGQAYEVIQEAVPNATALPATAQPATPIPAQERTATPGRSAAPTFTAAIQSTAVPTVPTLPGPDRLEVRYGEWLPVGLFGLAILAALAVSLAAWLRLKK
jgi:hypothetical protein